MIVWVPYTVRQWTEQSLLFIEYASGFVYKKAVEVTPIYRRSNQISIFIFVVDWLILSSLQNFECADSLISLFIINKTKQNKKPNSTIIENDNDSIVSRQMGLILQIEAIFIAQMHWCAFALDSLSIFSTCLFQADRSSEQ